MPDVVLIRVDRDIREGLNSITTMGEKFVVNDTAWYQLRGHGRVSVCVMNQAEFISRRFTRTLRDAHGWKANPTIDDQQIDGLLEIPFEWPGDVYQVPEQRFPEFFSAYRGDHPEDDTDRIFTQCYRRYCRGKIFDISRVEERYHRYFVPTKATGSQVISVGLEFETGNIASSFRALDKLDALFVAGLIDAGVFVTSINKRDAACRIWPASNRNGSFEELEHRNYKRNRITPLWEYGFAPDGFNPTAQYMRSDGTTYEPVDAKQTKQIGKSHYAVYTRFESNEQILLPNTGPTPLKIRGPLA